MPSSLFFSHNTALVPPYRVLVDTNFINFSLQNKLELMSGMMDCLYAKCAPTAFPSPSQSSFTHVVIRWLYTGIPCITDCVMAELEKLGPKYRVALRFVPPSPLFSLCRLSQLPIISPLLLSAISFLVLFTVPFLSSSTI